MKRMSVLFVIVLLAACNATSSQDTAPEELQKKLISAMTDYLYKAVDYDSSKVKYHIENVIYFDDKIKYICEFKVNMIPTGGRDTVGTMKAFVSKDFKKVGRIF
ncbi:MAG TPA: hypothetical protein PLP23_06445 [Panacibacter sp.]|nr:hypothetical protein [Panacibacter sp.]